MSAKPNPSSSFVRTLAVAMLLATTALWLPGTPSAAAHSYDICIGVGPNEVVLYKDAGFIGRCASKPIGEYLNSSFTDLPNDSISSVDVGANVRVMLCRDANLGACETLTASDSRLSNNAVGNDTISSIRVFRHTDPSFPTRCAPRHNQVALFEHAWFGGSCVVKDIAGTTSFASHDAIGLLNDSASSFKAGSSIDQVTLCRDSLVSGCSTFTRAMGIGSGIGRLSDFGLNDATSAMRATCRPGLC